MKIYRLQELNSQFGLLEVNAEELVEVFGFNAFDYLRKTTDDISGQWPECYGSFYDMNTTGSKEMEDKPDLFIWNNTFLMLSPRAYRRLNRMLAPFGSFLAVDCDQGEDSYLFACHSVVEADTSVSEILYNGTSPDGIKSLAFKPEAVGTQPVFKTSFDSYRSLYCSEAFLKEVEKNAFSGLIFNQDLSCKAGERV